MAQRKTTTKLKTSRKTTTEPVQVVATTTGLRMVEPAKSGKRRASKPKVVKIVGQTDDVFLNQVGGFTNFLKEYAVVGLAVGFIVGQQANTVIKQLVDSFVNPWVEVIFGQNLSNRSATLHHGTDAVPLPWGKFIYVMIQFFLVLITIYAVIKIFKLDRLKKSDDKKDIVIPVKK